MHEAKLPVPVFFDLSLEALTAHLGSAGWPAYRARQLYDWVYQKCVADPRQMTNLSKLDRQKLAQLLVMQPAVVQRRVESTDGTVKLLLSWPDGALAETVMIPDGARRTACISSQTGCPVGCRFCASGVGGLIRNLSPGQIVEQAWLIQQALSQQGQHLSNIVLMGMGEPLANYANVMAALAILHDPAGLNLGHRRITLSTVGVPQRIRQLADQQIPVNLAISLHAPTDALRRQLIPWAEHFSLEQILGAARYYFQRTGREVTLEYVLLRGVNDRPQHAKQLAALCSGLRVNVNLIRYNEVENLPYGRPTSADVEAFAQVLRSAQINVHLRKSRGRDIDAACGQLRQRQPEPVASGDQEPRTQ